MTDLTDALLQVAAPKSVQTVGSPTPTKTECFGLLALRLAELPEEQSAYDSGQCGRTISKPSSAQSGNRGSAENDAPEPKADLKLLTATMLSLVQELAPQGVSFLPQPGVLVRGLRGAGKRR